jgi:hypothetical protein
VPPPTTDAPAADWLVGGPLPGVTLQAALFCAAPVNTRAFR